MSASLQLGLYNVLTHLVFAICFPFFYLYSCCTGNHKDSIRQRLGSYKDCNIQKTADKRIWIHAASVGEVRAAEAIVPKLKEIYPDAFFVLSTMTSQGQQVAKKQLPSYVTCVYAPLDVIWAVKRALTEIRPTCYICLETELWPNILSEAHKRGIPLILLNGRLSERSFNRYRRIGKFLQGLLSSFSVISAISDHDAQRFRALGANSAAVTISGNVKYDLTGHVEAAQGVKYQKMLAIRDDQPVFIFGSTHTGEETFFVQFASLIQEQIPDSIFILAPRHLNRLAEIENLFSANGVNFDRFSNIKDGSRRHNVVLVDNMGELATLYSVGTFIFCGGSLVPKGGHNIMEAAIWGKPVFYGPHMKDFIDAVKLLESAQSAYQITTPEDFSQAVLALLADPQKYQEVCQKTRAVALAQHGSSNRQVKLVQNTLALHTF